MTPSENDIVIPDILREAIDNEATEEAILVESQEVRLTLPFKEEDYRIIRRCALNHFFREGSGHIQHSYELSHRNYESILTQLTNYIRNSHNQGDVQQVSEASDGVTRNALLLTDDYTGKIAEGTLIDRYDTTLSYLATQQPVNIPLFIDIPPKVLKNVIRFDAQEYLTLIHRQGRAILQSRAVIYFLHVDPDTKVTGSSLSKPFDVSAVDFTLVEEDRGDIDTFIQNQGFVS